MGMSKNFLIFLTVAGLAVMFAATALYAGKEVSDTFKIKTEEVKEHRKAAPEFTHKKHHEEYGISCGDCHHDENGEPLTDLKMGDDVQRCVACHDMLEKTEENRRDIMLLENAMHGNCVGCHKEVNKEETGDARKGPAPTRCSDCHPRE